MNSHKIAALAQASMKGPATFKTSNSSNRKKRGSPSKTPGTENLSPYKVQEAVYSILERSGGDLDRASQMLDERLSATNRLISELADTSGSLSHAEFRERMRALKDQHRSAVEMTEDLRAAEAAAAAADDSHRRKSVTFDDAKPPLPRPGPVRSGGQPPLPPPPPPGRPAGGLAGRRPMSASLEGGRRSLVDGLDDYDDCLDDDDETTVAAVARRRAQQERLRGRVKALWSDFDVHGSRQQPHHGRSGSLDRSWRERRSFDSGGRCSDSPESWRHRVTVPQPFSMTRREEEEAAAEAAAAAAAAASSDEEARRRLPKSRSLRRLEEEARRRREAEEAECRVRPRAAPVPAHVYQPLLRQLEEQRDARRSDVRQHSAEILRATERPFSFAKRDAERRRQGRDRPTEDDKRRGYHRSSAGDREATVIRAKPAPPSGAAERARQLREEAERRRAEARARSEANLRAAAMPGEMAERQRRMEAKRNARLAAGRQRPASADGRQRRPQVGRDAPDFDRLHRQFELEMLEKQAELRVTRPEPFRLLTGQRAHVAQEHTDKCLASGQDPRALRTLYDFSRRYPTDPVDDLDAEEAAAAEHERRRRALMSRDPEDEYKQKLRELDRKMKERDQLLAEQARMLAQQQACSRYRQSLLQAGVEPVRVDALVRAYRERELATAFAAGGASLGGYDEDGSAYDGMSTVPNESEFDEEQRGDLDETRFGAPSPVPN